MRIIIIVSSFIKFLIPIFVSTIESQNSEATLLYKNSRLPRIFFNDLAITKN